MPSRLWLTAGSGRSSQPVMVPLTVAVSTGAAVVARMLIVTLPASMRIQVDGAYPDADAVIDCLPGRSVHVLPSKMARPVESVVAAQAVGSAEPPTRTAAPEIGARVSSSAT